MHGFKKILIPIFLILLLLIISDFYIGKLFTVIMANYDTGKYSKIQYSIDKSSEDIIIIGTSRAECHYNPAIISQILNSSCWNAGIGGQYILFWQAIAEETLKRYSPKIFIINIDPHFLESDIDRNNFLILRPFAKTHKEISEKLQYHNWIEKYKLQSSIYDFNSVIFSFRRVLINNHERAFETLKGWDPIKGKISAHMQNTPYLEGDTSWKVNYQKIYIFNTILNLAKANSVTVVLVTSPQFHPYVKTSSIKYVEQFYKHDHIIFLDFLTDPRFVKKTNYFSDWYHLNETGANVFSQILADSIRVILKNRL
jgi:hypothetical protein